MSDPKYKNLSSYQYAAAGALSGFVTRFTCQPLDVLKILFQLQVDPKRSSKYFSILQAVSLIVREEGVSALWKGHVPAQWLSVLYGGIQFATYEKILKCGQSLEKNNNGNSINISGIHFFAGGISGLVAISISYPFDTIRTRLIAQQKSKLYKGLYDAGRQIWIAEGLKGYYKGLIPALTQIAPAAGLVFSFKNIYTQMWNIFTGSSPDSYQVSAKGHMVTGLSAGITSKIIIYPMDVIKKRLQIQGMDKSSMCLRSASNCNGAISCLIFLINNEGVLGLYKGITPALIKSGAANLINFTVYNEICNFIHYTNR